jgi:hypothetical protein
VGAHRVVSGERMRGRGHRQVVQVVARLSIARRGLDYPSLRAQSYRVDAGSLTRAHLVLLEGAGEEEFTRWVKSRAKHYGWMGWHLRDSESVIESVHTLRLDGFCDGLGVPDWEFWNEDLGQHFKAELKGASGMLGKHQKREIPSMRRGGMVCFVWYPRDASTIERIFRYGLGGPE